MKNTLLPQKTRLHLMSYRKRFSAALLASLLICPSLSIGTSYANVGGNGKSTKATAALSKFVSHSVDLKQLGVGNDIHLIGQDARASIDFVGRPDEVIVKASLKVIYKYSPDLLAEQSQFNIFVNGESIANIEIDKESGNKDLEVTVQIPPEILTEDSKFTFQLICRSTLQCEDPRSPKLWTNVSNRSVLTYESIRLVLQDDLQILPIPFVSKNDNQNLVLPFVFNVRPSDTSLEAAGIIASWFGTLASQSKKQFPVLINELPATGNAIIFVDGQMSYPKIKLPEITGPMVSIATNPQDPYGKYLFVMGRDANELKQASTAMVLGGQSLVGKFAALTPVSQPPSRKPYDAPNWLNSNGPVRLGDLAEPVGSNSVYKIQFPPALYSSDAKAVPLNLQYSYQNAIKGNATLDAYYKSEFLRSFTLPIRSEWLTYLKTHFSALLNLIGISSVEDDVTRRESTIYMPLSLINSDLRNSLPNLRLASSEQFDYSRECHAPGANNFEVIISPDSSLNISKLSHFIGMPNLSAFSKSGFPFSRLADLSETAVVLPDEPNNNDYSTYLSVLGRLGMLTGYPAVAVVVSSISKVDIVKDKDLLVISSGSSNPISLKPWEKKIASTNNTFISLPNNLYDVASWFRSRPKFDLYQDNFIAGIESPLQNNRSVVVISSANPEKLLTIVDALDGSIGPVYGSLVEFNDGQITRIHNNQNYHSGSLSLSEYIFWFLTEHFLLILLLSATAISMLSILIYSALKAQSKRRLSS